MLTYCNSKALSEMQLTHIISNISLLLHQRFNESLNDFVIRKTEFSTYSHKGNTTRYKKNNVRIGTKGQSLSAKIFWLEAPS